MAPIASLDAARPQALEFFAGIGLARLGLEAGGFRVAWANDYELAKMEMYETQFPGSSGHFALGDIGELQSSSLPGDADLAWASSPCTDLSIAGARAGLAGAESGTFWHVIRLLGGMTNRPEVFVLENVVGLATSHGGDDLAAAIKAFNGLGYSVDVLAIDARRFVPQSRPRLFLVGAQHPPVEEDHVISDLRPDWLQWVYAEPGLRTHRAVLPKLPPPLSAGMGDLMEDLPERDERWWDAERTAAFVRSLSPIQRERIARLRREPGVKYRTAYRRTRNGVAVWEVRADDIAGCLRTARGGSSKQAVVRLGSKRLKVRWMTPREYARLMGAPDYALSGIRVNQALFGFGDAVAVPAVAWLADNYLRPLALGRFESREDVRRLALVQ